MRISTPSRAASGSAVSSARRRSLDQSSPIGSAASFSASASACSRPAAESGGSLCPWIRPSRFHSVSPWRMRWSFGTARRLLA